MDIDIAGLRRLTGEARAARQSRARQPPEGFWHDARSQSLAILDRVVAMAQIATKSGESEVALMRRHSRESVRTTDLPRLPTRSS